VGGGGGGLFLGGGGGWFFWGGGGRFFFFSPRLQRKFFFHPFPPFPPPYHCRESGGINVRAVRGAFPSLFLLWAMSTGEQLPPSLLRAS